MLSRLRLLNACSIGNKWEELGVLAGNADIIGVTETWLHCDFEVRNVQPPGFTEYRVEKTGRGIGGGVLLLVKDSYYQRRGAKLRTSSIQAMECKVNKDTWDWSLVLVYRSPSADEVENQELNSWI